MSEHRIQNEIRNDIADHFGGDCLTFRANVGKGWTSSQKAIVADRNMVYPLQPGDVVLRQGRPFDTGLPVGFSDLFGAISKVITPDMVGKRVALFFAGEVKDEGGRVAPKQRAFQDAVKRLGGLAGVWRSKADARKTLNDESR